MFNPPFRAAAPKARRQVMAQKIMTIAEIAKLSSKDAQALICSVDENGKNQGFFSDAQLDVVAENATTVDENKKVKEAKKALANAKLEAYYSKGSDTAEDAKRIVNITLRKIVSGLGGKWDNKKGTFKAPNDTFFEALKATGTKNGRAFRRSTGTYTMLRTPAEIAGWLTDTCGEYLKALKDVQKTRKTLEDKIRNYYHGCLDFDDTPEIALKKTAKKFAVDENTVKKYLSE